MARSTRTIEGDETVHYVSPRAKRGRTKAKISVPMTAMIDVTFLLLIYFILTINFRQAEGQIPGTLPKAGASGAQTMKKLHAPIKITLYPKGDDCESVDYDVEGFPNRFDDPKMLYAVLNERYKDGGAESPIIINARSNVRWRFVVEVFNQVVANKFKNIAFQNTTQ
jgi:biopolymer transport protein ExbD